MSDGWTPIQNTLPLAVRRRVVQMCDRYEQAWRAGLRPRIEEYLGEVSDAERSALLCELLALEVEYRHQRGEQPTSQEYRARFPGYEATIDAAFFAEAVTPTPSPVTPEGVTGAVIHGDPGVGIPTLPRGGAAREGSIRGDVEFIRPYEGKDSVVVTAPEDPIAGLPRVGALLAPPRLDRFEILGVLGCGGMGVVYRARDRKRDETVALKTMQGADPAILYRFKREFRALADVSHPNLVNLYELISDGQNWFFTMEQVDGVDFLTYVRSVINLADAEAIDGSASPNLHSSRADLPDTRVDDDLIPNTQVSDGLALPRAVTNRAGPRAIPCRDPCLSPFQLGRLQGALRQLVEGVAALHDAGKLHRDIKPSNVLVTKKGRVVLLDFGLAAELGPTGLHQSSQKQVLGTVAYMAPEQAAGLPVSLASDWYSVGAMIYEALTGRPPFLGRPLKVLMDKQWFEPPPPHKLVPNVPEDLDVLCIDLLRRDPAARPSGRDILRRLGSIPSIDSLPERSTLSPGIPLIGRERHLNTLADAFSDVKRGRTLALYINGGSGVGKSALVQQFLDDLIGRDEALVLSGRCYRQESVPYKALDGVVDTLSRYLGRLDILEVRALLPRDISLLARVFPVLRRAAAVVGALRRTLDIPDPQELRRRAFAALREMLARVGDRRPLVVAIDDLQWGDVDSALLLLDLLRPPDPPVFLLLGCYRSEDTTASPFLRTMLGSERRINPTVDRRELAVEPLTPQEAEALAMKLTGGDDSTLRTIARESGGNPFFIHELVRSTQADAEVSDRPPSAGQEEITLDKVLWTRILRLPEEPRRLLEVIAVSGRPLGQREACKAAGLVADERVALAVLQSGRLVRSTSPADRNEIDTYHDRIREAVVAHLTPDQSKDCHRRLAHTLEESRQGDPETMAVHFAEAGEVERAGHYFAIAAAQAAETLAFDRAAMLYRQALQIGAEEALDLRNLRVSLGDALANAGRGSEAAREYLWAADDAKVADDALELRRLAAFQNLISGHIDEGIRSINDVLSSVKIEFPRSPRMALLSLVVRRAQLRLRGLGFRERDISQIAMEDLRRIDVCWSAGVGLSIVDTINGSYFQVLSLLNSLKAGEPYRIARALAMEAASTATSGERASSRTAKILRLASALAQRLDSRHADGLVLLATGMAAYLQGRWKSALDSCESAERTFREGCTGVAWERDTAQVFSLWSLWWLGEVAELGHRLPKMLEEARDRGDLYVTTILGAGIGVETQLAANRADEALKIYHKSMKQWPSGSFHIQHFSGLMALLDIYLFQNKGDIAWIKISEEWEYLNNSLILRIQMMRIFAFYMHALCSLAASSRSKDPRVLLREASRDARRLEREKVPWSLALAKLIRAELSAVDGDLSRAVKLLRDAISGLDAVDMALFAAVARRHLGQLLGGDEGRNLIDSADSWMASQGIRNACSMALMIAPNYAKSAK